MLCAFCSHIGHPFPIALLPILPPLIFFSLIGACLLSWHNYAITFSLHTCAYMHIHPHAHIQIWTLHWRESTQCLSFWVILHNITISSSIHVSMEGSYFILFYFSGWIKFHCLMCNPYFKTQPSIDRHPSEFYNLALVESAAVSMDGPISLRYADLNPVATYPRVQSWAIRWLSC